MRISDWSSDVCPSDLHPLAQNWMELEAANLMMLRAAELYDSNQPCGAEANAAKYLAAEAGFKACTQSVMTHGGFGYSKEFHVERYMREVMIPRIDPVSRELIQIGKAACRERGGQYG